MTILLLYITLALRSVGSILYSVLSLVTWDVTLRYTTLYGLPKPSSSYEALYILVSKSNNCYYVQWLISGHVFRFSAMPYWSPHIRCIPLFVNVLPKSFWEFIIRLSIYFVFIVVKSLLLSILFKLTSVTDLFYLYYLPTIPITLIIVSCCLHLKSWYE